MRYHPYNAYCICEDCSRLTDARKRNADRKFEERGKLKEISGAWELPGPVLVLDYAGQRS